MERFIELMRAIRERSPALRLGQILAGAHEPYGFSPQYPPLFYLSDDQLVSALEAYLAEMEKPR